MNNSLPKLSLVAIVSALLTACTASDKSSFGGDLSHQPPPGSKFDLSHWSLTMSLDEDQNGAADVYNVHRLQSYFHPDYFYLDANNHMVFASPNKAATERTSTNTRSELRYMSSDGILDEAAMANNFALAAHPEANQFASIGSRLDATLHVDHVATRAAYANKPPAYSVVVGQVHALQLEQPSAGVGWGNEPLKISYKKWPNHKTGSVFWTYERNLATDNPKRIDIAYPVWGNHWENSSDPGDEGIALGESFSYTVNVDNNVMHLIFTSENHATVHHQINLADNRDANGVVDEADYPKAYANETLYFKAGAYNQCSTKANDPSFRYPACSGTGNWAIDVANGDYTKVTFSKLTVSPAVPM
jgi:poly(beta-D-mannuronate) lyase